MKLSVLFEISTSQSLMSYSNFTYYGVSVLRKKMVGCLDRSVVGSCASHFCDHSSFPNPSEYEFGKWSPYQTGGFTLGTTVRPAA